MNLEERLPTISPLPSFMSILKEGYNITHCPTGETDPRHGLHIPLLTVATKSVAGSGWDLAGKRGSPSKRVIVLFIERIPALSLPRHGKRGEERRRLTRIRLHSCLLSALFPFSA